MSNVNQKAIAKILRAAAKWPGWRIKDIKNGWMLYPADKRHKPIVLHRSPSDRRGVQNMIAELRRAGAPESALK